MACANGSLLIEHITYIFQEVEGQIKYIWEIKGERSKKQQAFINI